MKISVIYFALKYRYLSQNELQILFIDPDSSWWHFIGVSKHIYTLEFTDWHILPIKFHIGMKHDNCITIITQFVKLSKSFDIELIGMSLLDEVWEILMITLYIYDRKTLSFVVRVLLDFMVVIWILYVLSNRAVLFDDSFIIVWDTVVVIDEFWVLYNTRTIAATLIVVIFFWALIDFFIYLSLRHYINLGKILWILNGFLFFGFAFCYQCTYPFIFFIVFGWRRVVWVLA